jgi:N-hydroxyarylamine O-acetyltransferase
MTQPPAESSIDLDAYFERIGYHGERPPTLATLRAIHAQPATKIPFENLSPLLRQAVFGRL